MRVRTRKAVRDGEVGAGKDSDVGGVSERARKVEAWGGAGAVAERKKGSDGGISGRNDAVCERGRRGARCSPCRAGQRKVFTLSVARRGGSGAGVGSDRAWLLLGADKAEWAGVGGRVE